MVQCLMALIFKICPKGDWQRAEALGRFTGSPLDMADGFIHLSSASQVCETAARHFAGQTDLVLVAVDAEALGAALKWELSRGGALFPHVYGDVPVKAAVWVGPLLWDGSSHVFPPETFA
jgi:uncharacterized protein (DUF952 family)